MTDSVDSANDTAQFSTECALYRHQRDRAETHPVWRDGVVVCSDCAAAIPSARLLAVPDCERCIDCQVAYEKGLRLGL